MLTRSGPNNRGKEPIAQRKRARNPLMKSEAGLTGPTAAGASSGQVAGEAIDTTGMPLAA